MPKKKTENPPAGGEEKIEKVEKKKDSEKTFDQTGANWYVVHTYSGHENKVAATLKQKLKLLVLKIGFLIF